MAASLNDSTVTGQEEWEERKAAKLAAFKKFVSRGGAMNPGSKVVPEGSPDCLSGMVFVLTGVYESLEREEMAELIKKYGGKVTTSVSKNTKYLVVGKEAGQSKLAKARTFDTKKLTEDSFLDLIREETVKVKEIKINEIAPEETAEVSIQISKVESQFKFQPKASQKENTNHSMYKLVPETSLLEAKPTEGQMDLWVDKYKPVNCKTIIGQQGDRSNMKKLKTWLNSWNNNHLNFNCKKSALWVVSKDNGAWAKCALLSGPPGVGKTTTAHLVCKELGYDVMEMNASSTRSKKMLSENVSDALNTNSVVFIGMGNANNKVTSKRVLLMEEVDGMLGNEDRGGMAELIRLIKTSKVPVVCVCNDRNHQKIRSLSNYCFDLRFGRPRVEQIKASMMSICFKEKIQIKPEALTELIIGCGQDMRQVLNHLSMVRASCGGGVDGYKLEASQAKKEAEMSKKTSVKLGPFDVCKKVFNQDDHKIMSFCDKTDLYFHDINLAGLFVQENYLWVKPAAAGGNKQKLMVCLSKAADSLAQGDLVENEIRSGMNWGLLPSAAVFCSVMPGAYMSGSSVVFLMQIKKKDIMALIVGFLTRQVQFPSWLGKNSKNFKMDSILQVSFI